MITVRTSYYSKVSRLLVPKGKYICISNSYPSWFLPEFILMKNLAPMWSDVEAYKIGDIDFATLSKRYVETLLSRFESIEAIHKYVMEKAEVKDGEEIVFLCWEKDQNTCHRTVLANTVFSGEYAGEIS